MRQAALPALPLLVVAALSGCTPSDSEAPDDILAQEAPVSAAEWVAADSSRILTDLAWLSADARGGRRAGSPEGAAAREFIIAALDESGIPAPPGGRTQVFPLRARGEAPSPGEGVNVLALVEGSALPDRYIALTAHYDHVGVRDGEIYNGADDNASGTVAVMSIARYLLDHPLRHSVLIGIVDAEESGLQGATALVEAPPVPLEAIALNVNLDMVSRSDSLLWAAGTYHYPQLRPLLEPMVDSAGVALRFGHDSPADGGSDDWTFSSDHGPFHRVGIPFIYFGVEDHPDYHRPTDDFQQIDPGFYMESIRTILGALIRLDEGLPSPGTDENR